MLGQTLYNNSGIFYFGGMFARRIAASATFRSTQWWLTFLRMWARFDVFFALFNGRLVIVVVVAAWDKKIIRMALII